MQVELLQHRGPNNKDFYINKNIGLGTYSIINFRSF